MNARSDCRRCDLHALVVVVILAIAAPAATDLVPLPAQPEGVAWPSEEWPVGPLPDDLDRAAFEARVEELFASRGRGGFADTRALLVVQGGRIVFERYAEGFGPDSRFQSWSMAKSVTNALTAVLVRKGKLSLDAGAPVAAWGRRGDPRAAITLLQMTTGLDNSDGFGEGSLGVRDFLRREIFDPVGMRSAQPEFAKSGEFIGGAFVHATARDWARFGYLYLRDGVWDGKRILPEGWVDFSRTLNPAENNHAYGAHFWVNADPPPEALWRPLEGGPSTVFMAEGASFQMVAMDPLRDLVAVRLGLDQGTPFPEIKAPFGPLISAFPVRSPAASDRQEP